MITRRKLLKWGSAIPLLGTLFALGLSPAQAQVARPRDITGCAVCNPAVLPPTGPRQGPHHFALRFGHGRGSSNITVYVNGRDVTGDSVEVLAGTNGTVWGYRRGEKGSFIRRLCPCGAPQAERTVQHGDVRVTL